MNKHFRVFVDEKEIYSGDLSEVPERFRKVIIEDLSEWAGSLGKRGLNELVYSHLTWYKEKGKYCVGCAYWYDEGENCSKCEASLINRFIYERNENLDMILTCIGMITKVEVSN